MHTIIQSVWYGDVGASVMAIVSNECSGVNSENARVWQDDRSHHAQKSGFDEFCLFLGGSLRVSFLVWNGLSSAAKHGMIVPSCSRSPHSGSIF